MQKFIPNLTEDEAKRFADYTALRKVQQGAILHTFSFSKDLYFIEEGCIEICNRIYVDGQGYTVHVSRVRAPHILGESSFMLKHREDLIAIASSTCSYYELTENALERLKKEEPSIAIKLLELSGTHMAERLQNIQHKIFENIASRSQNSTLTVELMRRFVGHTSQYSKEMEEKLFKTDSEKLKKQRKTFLEDIPKKAI